MPWDQLSQKYITLSNGNLSASAVPYLKGIGVAVDCDAKKIWYNLRDNRWNGDTLANQNPATGAGGFSLSGLSGNIYAGGSVYGSTATANFGASAWKSGIPSGFSPWGSSVTWNPSDKSENITLSNGDLTESWGTGSWQTARSTVGYSTGKYYYECSFDSGTYTMFGACDSSLTLTNHVGASTHGDGLLSNGQHYTNNANQGTLTNGTYGPPGANAWRTIVGDTFYSSGKYYFEMTADAVATFTAVGVGDSSHLVATEAGADTHGLVWISNGQVYYNNSAITTVESYTNSSVVGIAVDIGAAKIWFYATKWNNDVIANQDPANGIGGISLGSVGTPLFPALCLYDWTTGASTANFGAGGTFTHTIPSGFSKWESPPLVLSQKHFRFRIDAATVDAEPTWGAAEDVGQ